MNQLLSEMTFQDRDRDEYPLFILFPEQKQTPESDTKDKLELNKIDTWFWYYGYIHNIHYFLGLMGAQHSNGSL